MFITKKRLPRRTFLRGAGAAIALPFLDAMVPAGTALAATDAGPKPRMGFFYLPHGFIMDRWIPATEGTGFELSPILEPLGPYRSQLTIVSGLENRHAVGPTHSITPGTWLSCVTPRKSQAPYGGVTVDQMAAEQIGSDTLFPSIEVATENRGGSAACDGTYGCSFGSTLSFRTPTVPLPMESNPHTMFRRLFGQGNSPEEREAIARDYQSRLDMVLEETSRLRRTLGAADRAMLDNYLESVREIERRVQASNEQDLTQFDLPEVPAGMPDFDGRLRLMFDMIAVAYQANLTRIASFMMAAEVSNQAYTHLGIPDAFHPLSHHNNDPKKMDKLATMQRYHTEVFAEFVEKLAGMPDGDGSVLDNSILLFGGNMSDSARHDHYPLAPAIVGGGCGKLRGNQHIRCPERMPLSNVLLTLLDRAGVAVESVGDSTGDISEI